MRATITPPLLLAACLCGPAATAQEPGSPPTAPAPTPFERAVEKAAAGNFEAAIEILEPLAREPEAEPILISALGVFLIEAGRPTEALKILRPLTEGADADPAVLYNAGRSALAIGMTDFAEDVLSRSIAKVPDSPAARELGLLRGARQEFRQAYRLLRPWALAHPDDHEARMAAALCAVRLERVPEAEELLAVLPQDDARVGLLRGQVLLQKGEPLEVIAGLEPMLEGAPPEVEVDLRRTLAEAYATAGQAAKAVETLEGFVRGDPSLALQLSRGHFQGGDVQKALVTLEPHAVRLIEAGQEAVPASERGLAGEIAREHGRYLVNSGRFEDAVPFLELATTLDPDEKQAWYGLGQAMAGSGRPEEAQAALNRFQELSAEELLPSEAEQKMLAELRDPTGREIIRGLELLGEGRIEEALELARLERELAPADPRPLFLEGRSLLLLEQFDQALIVGTTLTGGLPDNADAHYLVGAAEMGLRNFPAAEAAFRRALEIDPEHLATMSDLGVLLIEVGREDEARPLLERLLELSPDNPVALESLARLP